MYLNISKACASNLYLANAALHYNLLFCKYIVIYTSLFNKLYAYVTLTFGFERQPLTQRGIYMKTLLINLKLDNISRAKR